MTHRFVGAELFGIDHVAAFVHAVERVLERGLCGDISMSSEMEALFIEVHDYLSVLIDHVVEGRHPSSEIDSHGKNLIVQLEAYLGPDGAE